MTNKLSPELFRVCDANLNRLKEGIRVIEDIMRYRDNNKELSSKLKQLRHKARIKETKELLENRDSINDVLRPSTKSANLNFFLFSTTKVSGCLFQTQSIMKTPIIN